MNENPNPTVIEKQLNMLSDFESKRTLVDLEKQKLIDKILTPEIKAEIEAIEVEFEGKYEAIDKSINVLKSSIKDAVISHGEKVRGDHKQCVYVKGRDSWDKDGLFEYAKEHPDVLQFHKRGNPSVQFRDC